MESDSPSVKPSDMPIGFEEPYGVMLFDNRNCSSPQYYLTAYKFNTTSDGSVYDWHIDLDLLNWTSARNWSTESRFLPEFLNTDPFMNHYQFSYHMFWQLRRNLILVQMPIKGAPAMRQLYHIIHLFNACPPKYSYLEDREMNFKQVLEPYEDFDSCFIHLDQKIICFGPNSFSSYDIDLLKTKDGQIRVQNASKDVPDVPIIRIIQSICNLSETTATPTLIPTIPTTNQTTTPTTVSTTTMTTISITTPSELVTTDLLTTPEESKKDKAFPFWIIIVLFLLLLAFIIIIIIIFMATRNRKKYKENRDFQNNKELIGRKSPKAESAIGSELMRSDLGVEKNGGMADQEYQSSIDSRMSRRSEMGANGKRGVEKIDGMPDQEYQSSIDSQMSRRSQEAVNGRESPEKGLTNASAFGSDMSLRSKNSEIDNKDKGSMSSMGMSGIQSNLTMRSQTDPKVDKKS